MSLVFKTAACLVMAALLAGCSTPPRRETPAPRPQQVTQLQVDTLTRQVILNLVELGRLQSSLEASRRQAPRVANLRDDKGGMQRVLYSQDPGGTPNQTTTPEQCALEMDDNQRMECEKSCPICSELTTKYGGGFPNSEKKLIEFSRSFAEGSAATSGTLADISLLVETTLAKQQ